MQKKFTLILGGARSGKSTYAEQMARSESQTVLFVATATAGDDEMAARILAHQAARPPHWKTLEAPTHVGNSIIRTSVSADTVVVDCLTLLLNNLMMDHPDVANQMEIETEMDREIEEILQAYSNQNSHWILVSNEVGLGLVPPNPLGRIYRDVLGRANQKIAGIADEVFFMVAGIPMKVK